MAIVALVTWIVTVAVGVYLLITSTRPHSGRPDGVPDEASVVVASVATASSAPSGTPVTSVPLGAADVLDDHPASLRGGRPADPKTINRNKFDPPSLARAKAETIPGGRALAEFLHPMLGITGFGLFLAYVMSRYWVLGAIALGIGIGAAAAGLTWAFVNVRGTRQQPPDPNAMSFSPRLLAIHVTSAAVTILLAALIVAKV